MAEKKYSFTPDKLNTFVDAVKSYPAQISDILLRPTYMPNLSIFVSNEADKFTVFTSPKDMEDLEKKVGVLLPYYIKGQALPDGIAVDELALAYQTILSAHQKAINDILYDKKAKEVINSATKAELQSGAVKEKLEKIEGIDLLDYLCIQEIVEKVCTYRHLPELMELADLLKKQGITGDTEIVLQGAPGSLIPKINLDGSPDLKNMFKDIPLERYQTALALYFMRWHPKEEEDDKPYGQQNAKTIEDALYISSQPTKLEAALTKAKDGLKVAIGW